MHGFSNELYKNVALEPPIASNSTTNEQECSRCKRNTHTASKCHAKKDIFGKDLTDFTPDLLTRQTRLSKKSKPPPTPKRKQPTKTRDCVMWVQGKCVMGDSCFYSHDDPKGWDPRSRQLCHFHRSGSCLKSVLCPYSHDKSRFACAFFHLRGRCTKKEECEFSHSPLSEEQRMELERDQARYDSKGADLAIEHERGKGGDGKEDLVAIYR